MNEDRREFEARRFFWDMMDRESRHSPIDVATAQRCIRQIAEALPPFTPLSGKAE